MKKKIQLPAAASNIDKVLEKLNKKQKITHTALDPMKMLMLSYAKTIKTFSPIRQTIGKKNNFRNSFWFRNRRNF